MQEDPADLSVPPHMSEETESNRRCTPGAKTLIQQGKIDLKHKI